MFTRDSSSAANLEQLNAYLDDYYQTFTTSIAHSRNISLDRAKFLIDHGPYGAQKALQAGLVDSLLYHDQLRAMIERNGKASGNHLVTLQEEKQATDWQYNWETTFRKKIAVIFAVGPITPGESQISPLSGSVSMGAATIVRAIRTARENPSIQAIVLRVDSPGGSALASDFIWREVHLTTTGNHPKPVIVSMGDVAGSGGYYISMAADSIIAQPGTLTGSIGVLFGQFSYRKLMEKIGVHAQTLQRGENADFLDPTRQFTEQERNKIYQLIDTTYQAFVNKAAAARGLPPDSVNQLGQGRIYSGTAAVQVGLVDALGGISKAIDMAKNAANIPPESSVDLEYLPNYPLNFFDLLTPTPTLKYNTFIPNEILNALKETEQVNLLSSEKILYIIPFGVQVNQE